MNNSVCGDGVGSSQPVAALPCVSRVLCMIILYDYVAA